MINPAAWFQVKNFLFKYKRETLVLVSLLVLMLLVAGGYVLHLAI